MLNETASSTEDRPALRSTVRPAPGLDDTRHSELRDMVATVFLIENETFEPDQEVLARDNVLLMNRESVFVASFDGRLLVDSEEAYALLDTLMKPLNYLPIFRANEERQFIHVVSGRANVTPRAWWINAVLF